MKRTIHRFLGVALLASAATIASAQTLTMPRVSPRALVAQEVGPVRVTIDYSSPHVKDAKGTARKIWGELVPNGLTNLGFGTCTECPWRAGANENTTFTVSDDVLVQGQPLKAGTYALFMIPDPNEWTIVFSNNSTSWGSFFYDAKEDALRVKAKPVKNAYREDLTYDFTERGADHAVVALEWEELAVPFTVKVENPEQKYLAQMRRELRNSPGFYWENWIAASQYAMKNKIALDEALVWAQKAADPSSGVGNRNFQTLANLAQLQEANGKKDEAAKTWQLALNHPTASAIDIHQYARGLLAAGKKQEAFDAWKLNAQKHGSEWPVNVGLARGYSAMGKYSEALKYAKLALAQAPDPQNKAALEKAVKTLSEGKDMN